MPKASGGYVESLSAYARQFLEMMQKPDVDLIEGLSPAISIEQKTTSRNPRSTVGTVTEIYDYMRLLWARVGIPYSPATGLPIRSQTVSQMVDSMMALPDGTRLYLLAPIIRGRKGEYRKELMNLQARGFQRVKIDGTLYDMDDLPTLDKKRKHDIAVVVDRVVIRLEDEELITRLADSTETALKLTDGLAIAEEADGGKEHVYSARFACPESGFTIDEIEPGCFPLTIPLGHALIVMVWANQAILTVNWWCPTPQKPSKMVRLRLGHLARQNITSKRFHHWGAITVLT